MHGNTVVTAVTVAIGENGSKIAYFSHSVRTVAQSARTAHGVPPTQIWKTESDGSLAPPPPGY